MSLHLAIPLLKWKSTRLLQLLPPLAKLLPTTDWHTPGVAYSADPQIDRIVFICGLHRSGTSLLEQYLHGHFEVSCLRAQVPENEGQHLQNVYPAERKYGGPGRFAFSSKMRRELGKLDDSEACRERILRSWRRYVVGDAPVLLEKSPPNLTKIGWLRSTFPGARFIVMVRDPRAVAAATLKWTKGSLEELVAHWHAAHSIAHAEFEPDDTCVIRYEDFCTDAEAALAASPIGEWLTRRSKPLPVDDRFATLSNSNERYLSAYGVRAHGSGIWGRFGYVL